MMDPFQKVEVQGQIFLLGVYPHPTPELALPFIGRAFEKNKASMTMAFFVWTAASGKIVILDNLRKSHVIVKDWWCVQEAQGIH
jgi:hypothetical protein